MGKAVDLNKGLWTLSWPIMISMAMSISLVVTDTLFLSRISDAAAAAVGSLLPVLVLANAVFSTVGQAGCAVAGQLLGAKRDAEVAPSYGALLLLNSGLGLGAGCVFFSLRHLLPEALGLEGEALGYAAPYLGLVGGAQVLGALQFAGINILNSRGQTRWTLVQALVSNLSNVVLNLLLLDGPFGSFGVMGIAWATVCSRLLGVSVVFLALVFAARVPITVPRSVNAFRAAVVPILQIGVPGALEPIAFETSRIVLTMFVVSMGAVPLAARVYVYNITVLPVIWSIGLGVGTQILIAYRIGEGGYGAANAQLQQSIRVAVAGSFSIILLLNLFLAPVLTLFTNNSSVVEACGPLMLVGIPLEIGRTLNVVVASALRSAGDARFVGIVGSSLMWTVAVPLGYLLGMQLGAGVLGIWIAMATDECVRGAVNLWRWNGGNWRAHVLLKPA